MKVALFVSSVGDTDLALKTISALKQSDVKDFLMVPLTETAQLRVDAFQDFQVDKINIKQLLATESFPETFTPDDLKCINELLTSYRINSVYIGVPSTPQVAPFQLAQSLDLPVLVAYEFMFKPEQHSLWEHLPQLAQKSNVHWAIPLPNARTDFTQIDERHLHISGHLSIDNAFNSQAPVIDKGNVRKLLQIEAEQSLTFISSTTQAFEVDSSFVQALLAEVENHPHIQLRLGLHPGIKDLDGYLAQILDVCDRYPEAVSQFKIILPDNLAAKLKNQEVINTPPYQNLFLKVNVSGADAAGTAERVGQAVPGALLNQAAIEGKPSYSHQGKPYLPIDCFSQSITTFFTAKRMPMRDKSDLQIGTAPENLASLLSLVQSQESLRSDLMLKVLKGLTLGGTLVFLLGIALAQPLATLGGLVVGLGALALQALRAPEEDAQVGLSLGR